MKKVLSFYLILAILLPSISNISYSSSINDLVKEREEIANKTSELKDNLNSIASEKKSISQQVEELDKNLDIVQKELDTLTGQLELTRAKLAQSEEELSKATETKNTQYENLKTRLRFMYEQNNFGYLEFMLNSTNFTNLLKRIEYINSIREYDSNLFKEYEETEALIQKKVQDIEIQKENIETLVSSEKEKRTQLENSINEKEKILKNLSAKEDVYNQQIEDLKKEDNEIKNLIISKTKTNTSSESTYSGQLEYPVPAYRGYAYNSPYVNRINPISGKAEFHTGVDLKATLGTNVVAAESGTVIYSGSKGGYGKTIIIDHGNGMTTLYGHNSSLVVNVGDNVSRGQVIAKAGSTGYSTGVHVHFEVRFNGNHVDPAPYIGH